MAVERQALGGLVFAVNYDFSKLERNFCKAAGLYPGQPRILTILRDNEGVTLSTLSPLCNIGMPSLSVSVRNLQKSGLIRKEGSGKNQKLYLTDSGRTRAQLFHEEIDAFYTAFFEEIGPEAAQQLSDSLQQFDSYIQTYNQRYSQKLGG